MILARFRGPRTVSIRGVHLWLSPRPRITELPLPEDVGKALVAYVRRGRPRCTSRRVFLRATAPIRGLSGPSTVGCIVRRAIRRIGVDAPTTGAHQLRHGLISAPLHPIALNAAVMQFPDIGRSGLRSWGNTHRPFPEYMRTSRRMTTAWRDNGTICGLRIFIRRQGTLHSGVGPSRVTFTHSMVRNSIGRGGPTQRFRAIRFGAAQTLGRGR
jgi:hypothetical protein